MGWIRNSTKLDAFFETCPGASPKPSQTNIFVLLGSKSALRCWQLEHQTPHKYLKRGLWSPFGFPLTRRSSPWWASDLKKVPKSMISEWFWLLRLGFSFCIVCSDLYIVPFGMVLLFFADLCLSISRRFPCQASGRSRLCYNSACSWDGIEGKHTHVCGPAKVWIL